MQPKKWKTFRANQVIMGCDKDEKLAKHCPFLNDILWWDPWIEKMMCKNNCIGQSLGCLVVCKCENNEPKIGQSQWLNKPKWSYVSSAVLFFPVFFFVCVLSSERNSPLAVWIAHGSKRKCLSAQIARVRSLRSDSKETKENYKRLHHISSHLADGRG